MLQHDLNCEVFLSELSAKLIFLNETRIAYIYIWFCEFNDFEMWDVTYRPVRRFYEFEMSGITQTSLRKEFGLLYTRLVDILVYHNKVLYDV